MNETLLHLIDTIRIETGSAPEIVGTRGAPCFHNEIREVIYGVSY